MTARTVIDLNPSVPPIIHRAAVLGRGRAIQAELYQQFSASSPT